MANSINLEEKLCYILITGASRGIGRTLIIESSKKLKKGSTVVLLARSLKGLQETKFGILKNNPDFQVYLKSLDLTKPSAKELDSIIQETYQRDKNYDLAIIVHNVGSIGDASKKARECESYKEMEDYYSLNVFAPIILNSLFLKVVKPETRKFVVNISTKAALDVFPSLSFYCSVKAARQIFFKVLAEEEKNNNILVLNYSPGAVETDMTLYIQNASCDEGIQGYFKELRSNHTILTTEQTTERFLDVLEKGSFQSGDIVDYYDGI